MDIFPPAAFNDEVLVTTHVDGAVVVIKINRPDRMNTMNANVCRGVQCALEMCASNPSVAVVVFTGAGERSFCAGGDLQGGGASAGMRGEAVEGQPPPTVKGAIRTLRTTMSSAQLLRDSHFVSIAAVNGAAAGAGLSWACACDLRICAENAKFRASFLSAGLSGDFGGSWLLPRIVGPAKARELYLFNNKLGAEEAVRIGLCSAALPLRGDAFLAAVVAQASVLATAAPLALKRIKANLNDADRTTFAEHLDLEAERHVRCGYHPDAMEAGMAFMGKRRPEFTGIGDDRAPWEMSRL
tara:strand:+ start:58 stop:951 length:894 start_codon:yes stop_codon:yes gene_type:complete